MRRLRDTTHEHIAACPQSHPPASAAPIHRTRKRIRHHGSHRDHPAVRHIATMPNRAILTRLVLNQASRAEANGKRRRALTLYERIGTFARAEAHAW